MGIYNDILQMIISFHNFVIFFIPRIISKCSLYLNYLNLLLKINAIIFVLLNSFIKKFR